MSDSHSARPSLLTAGTDVRRARELFKALAATSAGTRQDRQLLADEVCGWLRMAWGPAVMSKTPTAEFVVLVKEVSAFLVARLAEPESAGNFCDLDMNLSRTTIRDTDFRRIHLTGGCVDFRGCLLEGSTSFAGSKFTGGQVAFDDAVFSSSSRDMAAPFAEVTFDGAEVTFYRAEFRNGYKSFSDCRFLSGAVAFDRAKLNNATLFFTRSIFAGATVTFYNAAFIAGSVSFFGVKFSGGRISFDTAVILARLTLESSVIDGAAVSFDHAEIGSLAFRNVRVVAGSLTMREILVSSGQNRFDDVVIAGGEFIIDRAKIIFGELHLGGVSFISGTVSLEGIVIELEGVLHLPWARYTGGGTRWVNTDFDGRSEHDFYIRTAHFSPDVTVRWGTFAPNTGPMPLSLSLDFHRARWLSGAPEWKSAPDLGR